jgi:WD40 repeat protein
VAEANRFWPYATAAVRQRAVGERGTAVFSTDGRRASENSIAYSPDGRVLASQEPDKIKPWDVATGKEVRTLTEDYASRRYHWVMDVSFSTDGAILVAGWYDGWSTVWDVATGRELRALRLSSLAVASIAFSPRGKTFASGLGDATVLLWDLEAVLGRR